MRDINKIVADKTSTIQAEKSALHADLDRQMHDLMCGSTRTPTPKPATKQKRRVVRSGTVAHARHTGIDTGLIGMAYGALTSDPTTGLKGKDITAVHIQAWLDDEYCTMVALADVDVAMKAYKHTK